VAFVRYYAGSIPFFVQALAAVRLAHKNRNFPLDARAVTQRLVSEMWPYFEQWWSGFNDVERAVLLAVIQEKPVSRLPYDEREVAMAVRRLTDYGMLNRTGDQVWADSRLFSQWLLEYTGERPAGVKSLSEAPAFTSEAQPLGDGNTRKGAAGALIRRFVEARHAVPVAIGAAGDVTIRDYFLSLVKSDPGTAAIGAAGSGMGNSAFLLRQDGSVGILVECGLWHGQKALLQKVDQLLSRGQIDAGELALFVVVKPAELPLVSKAVHRALPHHAAYAGNGSCTANRRITCQIFAPGNPRRPVNLTVLLYPLAG
jgi:hypothetical protein